MNILTKTISAVLSCTILFSFSALSNNNNKSLNTSEYIIKASATEIDNEEILNYNIDNNENKNNSFTDAIKRPFDIFEIYDAYKNNTSTTPPIVTPQIPLKLNGIDVSMHQGYIDWSKVKQDEIQFAIIRAGYGKEYDQEDPYFDYNIMNAKKNNIDCGVYWYSYANSIESAYREAEVCYSIIKEYNYEYPIYFDIEERLHESMTTAEVSGIVEAFCSTLRNKGYRVGIYSYASFLSTKIYTSVLQKYDVWVAHYGVKTPAYSGEYGIWQHSSTGKVNGINGSVDLNYGYVDYSQAAGTDPVHTTATSSPHTSTTTVTTTKLPVSTTSKTTNENSESIKNGISVSMWQGDINWENMKNSNIEFAIIRAGYGNLAIQEDPYFDKNMVNAKNAGIDCGTYWYSYARTPEDAIKEAEVCYSTIKDYSFEYPVIFAIADSTHTSLSADTISAIIDAFCSTLESKGYRTAVQTNTSFLNYKINDYILEKYDICVEHFYTTTPSYNGEYKMWQYSCTGQVNGISGDVILIRSYFDYSSLN